MIGKKIEVVPRFGGNRTRAGNQWEGLDKSLKSNGEMDNGCEIGMLML
jgi:hypothetical protein